MAHSKTTKEANSQSNRPLWTKKVGSVEAVAWPDKFESSQITFRICERYHSKKKDEWVNNCYYNEGTLDDLAEVVAAAQAYRDGPSAAESTDAA